MAQDDKINVQQLLRRSINLINNNSTLLEFSMTTPNQCNMTQQGTELSQIMSPDEVENVRIFIIQPNSQLDPAVRGKLSDYYTSIGQQPADDCDYYTSIANDFGPMLRGEMTEAAWDDVLDKSGRYKGRAADPGQADKYLKGLDHLSLVDKEDDGGRETTLGHSKQHRATLSPKRVREMKENYVSQLRVLLESEIDEAEIVIAVKGISKSLQEMIEKIGRLQNEDLPPLSDQVRDVYDISVSTGFQESASQALQNVLDTLFQAKDEMDMMVQKLASGAADISAGVDMDAPLDVGMEPDAFDVGLGDDLGDDFGGIDAAAGPEEEPLGRAKKESVQHTKHKIAEMQRMIAKAKKLKERK